jgi:hypothetical protein
VGQLANLLNLLAAIGCTLGTAIGASALMLAEHSVVNLLGALGCIVGTIGGAIWIAAAYIALRFKL